MKDHEKIWRDWINYRFESSSNKTPEFKKFAREFRSYLKKQLTGYDVTQFSIGHFYVSYFVYNTFTRKYVYISISDVRHFFNDWYNHILIRTAKDFTDYTGGMNHYTSLPDIKEKADLKIGQNPVFP